MKILLILIVSIVSYMVGCSNVPPIFEGETELWASSPQEQSIFREGDDGEVELIQCKDPDFAQFTCLTQEDYNDIEKYILTLKNSCKQWK